MVTLPNNSPLIKLANLPKKIPIGETQAIIYNKKKFLIFFFKSNICVPNTTPTRAP